MRPTSQHPQRRVPTSSRSTTGNHPNGSTYPETKPVHTDDSTLPRRPGHRATTTLRRNTPGSTGPRAAPTRPPATHRAHHAHIPSNASPNSVTTWLSFHESHLPPHADTHSPHSKVPTQAKLTTPDQAVHLQYVRTSYSFAQGGSRGNRGWPGHRHSKATTPQAVPTDTEGQTPHKLPSTPPLC